MCVCALDNAGLTYTFAMVDTHIRIEAEDEREKGSDEIENVLHYLR